MIVSVNPSGSQVILGIQPSSLEAGALSLFRAGAIVLLTLSTPREKFWGALLELNLAGISIRGISLASLDDCIQQLRAGERVDATAVFFPLHRLERMEIDARSGELPSLGESFESQSGIALATFFGEVQR